MNDSVNRFTLSTHFQNDHDWVSQAEAARLRGVSRQAISRLIKKGRLKVLKIGGKVLLNRTEIEAFVPEQPGRPANERLARSNQEAR
ncbi:MAG: helix-turn-helix domain-containing protein [Acidobacteriaceae bacterium]